MRSDKSYKDPVEREDDEVASSAMPDDLEAEDPFETVESSRELDDDVAILKLSSSSSSMIVQY